MIFLKARKITCIASAGLLEPAARVTRRTPGPIAAGKRNPSGVFDALETDFFAREADLYKTETENFDDLDRARRPRKR